MEKIPKILFFSRGSASRGQIAEGLLRSVAGDRFIPVSAGADADAVSPLAAEVMREVGIDISTQRPREVASLFHDTFHCVIVMCDESCQRYPVYPFARRMFKWSVSDPEVVAGEPEARKQEFRKIRDQIRNKVEEFVATMSHPGGAPASSYTVAA